MFEGWVPFFLNPMGIRIVFKTRRESIQIQKGRRKEGCEL